MPDDPVVPEHASAAPSYEQLVAMVAERDAVIAELRVQMTELARRVAELEARLGADSSNSSIPPSPEGLRKKPAPGMTARRPEG